ncbi:NTP transferase domain-containing protein [Patescibacteria group bacterium]|nr:NTP transferase domain-containing protein [Patescibacteria group bacterium]MBU1500478.1 NTP transferase domain-containing protein [Patescibacteria group bacterium]MBU2080724.1 NTP transferase domain-containing protein [Patescibacteria group bacterium]MBU2123829.1 NTP transferase domain-containing protein [Patescibacteria group bacterium]MBU2194880.1 NTP transferase domain-containing protein [Patescibacteria group bacterium]
MQAVILAAGEGKRMRPLTLDTPKPLIEINGKPIIEYIIDALPEEVDEVIVVVGYKGEMIRERLGDSYAGRRIQYVHQWMPAGTAHALSIARPLLKGRFLFMYGDDIHGAEALMEATKHPYSLLAAPHAEPSKFGVIERHEDGTLKQLVEKPENPASNLVSTGGIMLDERIFDYPAPRHESGEYFLTDPVASLGKDHPIMVIEQPLWIPVGYPEDIGRAEEILKELGR